MYGPRYFGAGGDVAAPEAEAENSGGWRRKAWNPGETDTDREARIRAERMRMGILPPDPAPDMQPDALGSDTSVLPVSIRPNEQSVSLAAHLLPEDLAGLEALAARAAQLTMDQEIAMWLRLQEQRRLHEEWLRDEDDTAVLLLAIATIH
jgi:hypothetical protein